MKINKLIGNTQVILILPLLLGALSMIWGVDSRAAEPEALQELLRTRVEQLRTTGQLEIQGANIAAARLIPAFYERRNFRLAWPGKEANAQSLLTLVEESRDEGLKPNDYHFSQIRQLLERVGTGKDLSAEALVDLDICLTDALTRYAYHRRFGKVNPEDLDSHWNFKRSLDGSDPVTDLGAAIDSDSLSAFLDDRLPHLPYHGRLKGALRHYQAIAEQGAWPTVAKGPMLKPGMEGPRVAQVRKRLIATGDMEDNGSADPERFDDALTQGVKHFQEYHGLDADGIVGAQTLAAMNVPVEARVDQIRVNLERSRWVAQDIPDTFIVVDIAGFRATLVKGEEELWDERVVVGRPYRKTPVFRSTMTYLVINPDWTIPPGILRKDILPKLKKDPNYLEEKRLQVLTRDGRAIDPATVDWSQYPQKRFPYLLRQKPGPNNALGRVKFMFPNHHLVYLHDTPSKSLFEKTQRAFSSGCIRIENPYELAELLLDDPATWSQEQIQQSIDAEKTRTVFLPKPVPVLLLYWTVDVDKDGTVRFRQDLYGRDAKVLEGLNRDFSFSPPSDLPEWDGQQERASKRVRAGQGS